MTRSDTCTVIVGAGPYGLASAAHLRAANVPTRVFGPPMSFWARQMPIGMFLRSPWEGSHIADPDRNFTLDRYYAERGMQPAARIPIDNFVGYGRWVQQQVVPDLDQRTVTRVERVPGGFQLTLQDGDSLQAERVVIAAGIAPFLRRPQQFGHLPSSLASHSSEHRDLQRFAGKRVAVVGGGQSALESAVLLHEVGAEVEVLMRASEINWIGRTSRILRRLGRLEGPARRVVYTRADVGPPGINWLISAPHVFRRLPREWQDRFAQRAIRPAGAAWLQPRAGGVRITMERQVVSASSNSQQALLRLDDGSERSVDHVLLATGFRVDITNYPFLDPQLVQEIRQVDGLPDLTKGFESSVPGLHFVGAPAARSFGPLMRFVAGTEFTAPALTRGIASGQPVRAYAPARAYS